MITSQQHLDATAVADAAAAGGTPTGAGGSTGTLRLKVRDVTGSRLAEIELDPGLRVGAITDTVASRMALPTDTAWALRDDMTAAFLDDDVAIGDAINTVERAEHSLVMVPRAHLGGR